MFFGNFQLFLVFLLIHSTLGKIDQVNNFLDDLIFEEDESQKANDDDDAINTLPGLNFELNFKHYSGSQKFIKMYFRQLLK